MKNTVILILVQSLIALVVGILSSKMSFIGRLSIRLVHTEYAVLKVWWQTALLCFIIQLVLILLFESLKKVTSIRVIRILSSFILLLALMGLYYTYHDFTTTLHRYMRMKFHIAGYLFWGS